MPKAISARLDPTDDADIIAFLLTVGNKSEFVREAVRDKMGENSDPTRKLLLQILAELTKRPAAPMPSGTLPPTDEAHEKLGALGRWS